MYTTFIKFLDNPESLKLDVPIGFANQKWGDCWQKNKLRIYHESGKKWVVRVRTENSTPIITDGWDSVVKDLNLPKGTLLVFRPLGDFGLELSCFVDDMCGESYFTFNRYARFGFTVIEDCFIKQFYVNSPPSGKFQICYKGSYWNVEVSKVDTNFVFARGWPEMCNDVGILEDDLLVFSRTDDVVFDVVVYRDETEICFSKKPESDDDSVLEISKADYVENVFKDIYEDEEVVSVGEGRTVTQKKLPTNAECTSKRHMSSRVNKTQDKGKVTSERKETVKNMTKGNTALHVNTSDHIGCSSSAHKVKCLPVEVARRAGLSIDLHPLKVQNMVGVVEVYDVKSELNELKPRYALDGWRKFMTENNLRFGDMLHFTYVSSQQKIVLNQVTSV
ncbi:putative transcription factor B3-Domain family [Helianthus annuus]|nr:putative transcription factor B3-Domain family [Helianthus annuus]